VRTVRLRYDKFPLGIGKGDSRLSRP
jgi:hypothetical protein